MSIRPASVGAGARKAAGVAARASSDAQAPEQAETTEPTAPSFEPTARRGWQDAVARTVAALHYDVVDIERSTGGLLRVTIDRVPGREYPTGPSPSITIEDCEAVTHQLLYALEVDGVDYRRLEVSSPGLDRPLKTEADLLRFCGEAVDVTLRAPLKGRKRFRGLLSQRDGGWRLALDDTLGLKPDTRQRPSRKAVEATVQQVLDFEWNELREARLVPVVNFKGRAAGTGADEAGGLEP